MEKRKLAIVGVLFCIGVLVLRSATRDEPRRAVALEASQPAREPAVVIQAAVARGVAPTAQRPHIELASDGLPILQANGDDTSREPKHPHPITPAHARIFRENELLASLNGAVDIASASALRALNQKYRAEYPEDDHAVQSGYDLITDCLEQRNAATRARAEQYFREERGSVLRRYVKRHCLD